ncbi:antitoxin [Burkholderiaceae bacterium 16]|nr:antitoxin [Burkholderiaceae bacterium 16]
MGLPKVKRGEIWEVDFEPQAHKEEPGKRKRPALVIQTNLLNDAGHPTTIVVPGTTQVRRDQDYFPLRVAIGKPGDMPEETDLLIDQVRAISNNRLMGGAAVANLSRTHIKRVEEALKLLQGL